MRRILFHGTAHNINAFTEDSIGKGTEPNAALGVHTADDPIAASGYAELAKMVDKNAQEATVLVIEYLSTNQAYIHDADDFYGTYDDETNTHTHFAELRRDHIEDGIDLIDFEGGEDTITTLLIPTNIKIIDRLSIEEAQVLGAYLLENDVTWNKPEEIIKAIEINKIKGN
jgi:hypothetical protein